MALYIQTNYSSMVAQTNLSNTQTQMQTTFARLASGYRINGAADDAAGLGIAESFNAQVRSFGVASATPPARANGSASIIASRRISFPTC